MKHKITFNIDLVFWWSFQIVLEQYSSSRVCIWTSFARSVESFCSYWQVKCTFLKCLQCKRCDKIHSPPAAPKYIQNFSWVFVFSPLCLSPDSSSLLRRDSSTMIELFFFFFTEKDFNFGRQPLGLSNLNCWSLILDSDKGFNPTSPTSPTLEAG